MVRPPTQHQTLNYPQKSLPAAGHEHVCELIALRIKKLQRNALWIVWGPCQPCTNTQSIKKWPCIFKCDFECTSRTQGLKPKSKLRTQNFGNTSKAHMLSENMIKSNNIRDTYVILKSEYTYLFPRLTYPFLFKNIQIIQHPRARKQFLKTVLKIWTSRLKDLR